MIVNIRFSYFSTSYMHPLTFCCLFWAFLCLPYEALLNLDIMLNCLLRKISLCTVSLRQVLVFRFRGVAKMNVIPSQHEIVRACCAIEVSLNRLSFAKLRLATPGSDRIILDVWDSVPLRLPSGKDFKPHLCVTVPFRWFRLANRKHLCCMIVNIRFSYFSTSYMHPLTFCCLFWAFLCLPYEALLNLDIMLNCLLRKISLCTVSLRQVLVFRFRSVAKMNVIPSQHEIVRACCAIEVSLNRLSFAKLRLATPGSDRIILDVWDSVPLRLPSGKDFKPHLCVTVVIPALDRMVSNLLADQAEHGMRASLALIIGSMPLTRSATLNYAGMIGYLIGSVQHRINHIADLPVYMADKQARKKVLSTWTPCPIRSNHQTAQSSLSELLTNFPRLDVDPARRSYYASLLAGQLDSTSIQREHPIGHYDQLLFVRVACRGDALGEARAAVLHMERYGLDPTALQSTQLIFRPVMSDRTSSAGSISMAHHATVLGYLSAILTASPDSPASSPNHDNSHINRVTNVPTVVSYPDQQTVAGWVGQPPKLWPQYLKKLLQNRPDIHLHLVPRSGLGTRAAPHTMDLFDVYLEFESDTVIFAFESKESKQRDRWSTQFLLSRCFLTCLYHIFSRDFDRLT
ncbi:hypothetical protein AHF37_05562 [Paragonimus kellicotti]|nr:hypothetical protein AHF37_05562 [Paragonimus kellicotti]